MTRAVSLRRVMPSESARRIARGVRLTVLAMILDLLNRVSVYPHRHRVESRDADKHAVWRGDRVARLNLNRVLGTVDSRQVPATPVVPKRPAAICEALCADQGRRAAVADILVLTADDVIIDFPMVNPPFS